MNVLTKELQYKKVLRYRWVVYGVLIISYFLVFFHRMSIGVVKDELMSGFDMSATSFANLGAMYFYAYAIMQIPAGILADTIGVKKTIIYGSIVTGIGSIIFGFATSVFFAFVGRSIVGIGVAATYISIAKIQTEWFREREFGTILGMTNFIGNMGGVIAQTPLAIMVATFTYAYTFMAIGILSLLTAVAVAVFVFNKPEDMGLPSMAEVEGRIIKNQIEEKVNIMEGLKGVLGNKDTWPSFFVLISYAMTFFAFAGTWGVSYFADGYNMSKVDASNNIIFMLISMAFGALVVGYFSDKIRKRKLPLILFGVIANIAWIIFVVNMKENASPFFIRTSMGVFGFFVIGFTMCFSITKDVNNPRYSGMAMAAVNTGPFIGGALGPVIFGMFIDQATLYKTGPEVYQNAMYFCIVMNAIGLFASFFTKETNCKNIYLENQMKG